MANGGRMLQVLTSAAPDDGVLLQASGGKVRTAGAALLLTKASLNDLIDDSWARERFDMTNK